MTSNTTSAKSPRKDGSPVRIRIDNEYIVTSDENQYILNKVWIADKGKFKGQEVLRAVAFYSTLDRLIMGLLSRKLKMCGATSFEELRNALKEFESSLDIIKGV